MTEAEVNKFEKIQRQLEGLYNEVGILSKKNPNDAINKFKLKFINQVLTKANSLLKGRYKPFEEFEIFKEDEVPTNSDVTMICEQYLNCLENLRSDNIICSQFIWYWMIDNQISEFRTKCPHKLRSE